MIEHLPGLILPGILSDGDISELCLNCDTPMITPFHEKQKTQGMISYGLSSYGYDATLADTFKVFTNTNNAIIDPKNFNNNCVVEKQGDTCIIPPNSFLLGHTVEVFDMPVDVLGICLGKSTYARCFSGTTKVALVNGTSVSFGDMVKRSANGERFWGYSIDQNNLIHVAELQSPRKIGHEKLIAVELDNGEIIEVTPDHKFKRRDGSEVEAQHLKPEDSLFPLYRSATRGYEAVYQPQTGAMISTHWLADLWNIRHNVYESQVNSHRHHVDHDKRNNKPTNIVRIDGSEHISLHNDLYWSQPGIQEIHGAKVSLAIEQLMEDVEWAFKFSQQQSAKGLSLWHNSKNAAAKERVLNSLRNPSDQTRSRISEGLVTKWNDAQFREEQSIARRASWTRNPERRIAQANLARNLNLRSDITENTLREALTTAGTKRGAARLLKCDRTTFNRFPHVLSEHVGSKIANNHKVVSVKEIEGTHDVYCLAVPEYGNFALDAGVFVNNCGLIVNVTPLEPGWRGQVTIEISNTTPLPAIVYAHEGVCQFLFLKGNKPCLTSYRDRAGKYMDQRGVVLPKVLA